jgi:signal transduction histidine kinase
LKEFSVPGKAVGHAAADLPWLCPNTDSLIGLAERPADLARLSSADPALLLFLLRFAPPTDQSSVAFPPEQLLSPTLAETAAAYLGAVPGGWLVPSYFVLRTAREVARLAAAFAHRIATTGQTNPDAAAAVAQLAPLGWYAVEAVGSSSVLGDPDFGADPAAAQAKHWGLDHDAIARRLAIRWRLPAWVATVVGHLNLPLRAARTAAADADLFAAVQLAVVEAEARRTDLGLARSADRDELLDYLGLDTDTARRLFREPAPQAEPISSNPDPNPHRVPLVRNLLRMAGESRRRNGASVVLRLEQRIDELHRGLGELGNETGARVRDAKLAGLAELAAGAGHEINNPLAVISGISQRLMRTEQDDDRADALRTIVRQTQRIAGILRGLMQFARPPRPQPAHFPASDLLAGVAEELAPIAAERKVQLTIAPAADLCLDVDPGQLRLALAAVVRNGIEAVPKDGWVRVSCESHGSHVRFLIEDSGPGLTPDSAEHAFDPFYCGRQAGRGRGLGLPTAWRLVRENGGDVRYDPAPDGVTRFVVRVPRADPVEQAERRSA